MTPAQVERFKETPRCIACAACYSACPAVEADPIFPDPWPSRKLYRFVVDPRDGGHEERLLRIQTEGYGCACVVHLCTERVRRMCGRPSGSANIEGDGDRAPRRDGARSKHAVGFKENMRERGILNEFKLVRQTYNPIEMIGQIPQGLRVYRKKPEILHAPPKIEGQEEVDKLDQLLEDADESEQ